MPDLQNCSDHLARYAALPANLFPVSVVIYGIVLNASVIIIIFGIYHFGLNLVAPASLASLATGSAVAREAGC